MIPFSCWHKPAFSILLGPVNILKTIFRVCQESRRYGFKMFKQLYFWVFSAWPLIKILGDSFVSSSDDSFERTSFSYTLSLVILKGGRLYVVDSAILLKIRQGFLELISFSRSVDFIDRPEILSAHFVNDVRAVRLSPFLLLFEETELSGFTELSRLQITSLRLLLRFQLSSPLEDKGSLILPVWFM